MQNVLKPMINRGDPTDLRALDACHGRSCRDGHEAPYDAPYFGGEICLRRCSGMPISLILFSNSLHPREGE
jgi:hypothetical protein